MSKNIVHVSDESFEQEVLNASGPVLIDYWAEWCGPCKMIAPIIDELAEEYGEKIKIAKFNIDENPETPPRYGIRSIPTLMLFKNGNVEATKVGRFQNPNWRRLLIAILSNLGKLRHLLQAFGCVE